MLNGPFGSCQMRKPEEFTHIFLCTDGKLQQFQTQQAGGTDNYHYNVKQRYLRSHALDHKKAKENPQLMSSMFLVALLNALNPIFSASFLIRAIGKCISTEVWF